MSPGPCAGAFSLVEFVDMNESWKPIAGYEGLYEISTLGRVKSVEREVPHGSKGITRIIKERYLKHFYGGGYSQVKLSKNGKKRTHRVHLLVLYAFVGPPPDGMEARHLDGVRDNPKLENLKWGTRTEQAEDRKRHGTFQNPCFFGEEHPMSKLTESQVSEIKSLDLSYKGACTEAAKKYGVSRHTIGDIKRGRTWQSVKPSI